MPAQLLYITLITHADDEGCFRADPKHWSRVVFYDKRQGPTRVERMLDEMRGAKLIVTGETSNGPAGFIVGWFKMQTLSATKSKPSDFFELLVAHGITPRWGIPAQEKLGEEKRSEEKIGKENDDNPASSVSEFRKVAGGAWEAKNAELSAEKRALAIRMSMSSHSSPNDFDEYGQKDV